MHHGSPMTRPIGLTPSLDGDHLVRNVRELVDELKTNYKICEDINSYIY